MQTLQSKILEVRRQFVQSNDREPSHEEISDIMDIPEKKISLVLQVGQKTTSLDKPAGHDTDTTVGNLFADENMKAPDHQLSQHESSRIFLENILKGLPSKHRYIVSEYYGLNAQFPKTLSDIAQDLDLSKERVRQIRDKAIHKLKRYAKQRPAYDQMMV